jgi:hypothetical protein
MATTPTPRHLDVHDPDDPDTTWRFDLRFLLSHYHCIWGRGCRSVRGDGSAQGCCSHGVYVEGGDWPAEDRGEAGEVAARIAALTPDEWQNHGVARRLGGWSRERERGSVHTRVHRSACIMFNREDHPNGPGCALHQAALARGEDPLDWKPRACWTVPIHVEHDDDARRWTVRAVRRSDWGSPGAIDWWCTSATVAHTAERPVWQTLEPELRRTCGDAVYERLAATCRGAAPLRASRAA